MKAGVLFTNRIPTIIKTLTSLELILKRRVVKTDEVLEQNSCTVGWGFFWSSVHILEWSKNNVCNAMENSHTCNKYLIWFRQTWLLGARRMSPMPPPLRRPWLSVVTIHMTKESQARSFRSPSTLTITGVFPDTISLNKPRITFAYILHKLYSKIGELIYNLILCI